MKIATVGTGFIVNNFIDAARDIAGVEIAAVYSRDANKAQEFAKANSVKKHYFDKNKMLADADINFVYVASPNSLHYEWTKAALLAGKNVICEKPFVTTVDELLELIELAKNKKLFLFEAITVSHLPNLKSIQENLSELGSLKMTQMNFSQYSSKYDALLNGENPNVFNTEFSGGALMDLNYYNLYFAYKLFGKPDSYKYTANIADNGIDTSGVLVLKYADHICVAVACKDSKSKNMVQIQGEKGYIYVPEPSSVCVSYSINTNNGEKEYNCQENENVMYYELQEFKNIYDKSDFDKRDELLKDSENIMDIVEKARKDAGIIFAVDKKDLGD